MNDIALQKEKVMKSMKLGGGGRFAALKHKLEGEGKSDYSAGAIAASIGRKKYGKKKMESMAHKSKLRHAISKRRSKGNEEESSSGY